MMFSQGSSERGFASIGDGLGRLFSRRGHVLMSFLGLDLDSRTSSALRGERRERFELTGPRGLEAFAQYAQIPFGVSKRKVRWCRVL